MAGAMSMATGEYVSVSSQSDTERADLARETLELQGDPAGELQEVAAIYVARGLDFNLAQPVAEQLMAKDALGAHARDELGISEVLPARPIQAALTSECTFAGGAALPLIALIISPAAYVIPSVSIASLVFLAALGAVGARVGGASLITGAWRVLFWGAAAMAMTAAIGSLVGTTV